MKSEDRLTRSVKIKFFDLTKQMLEEGHEDKQIIEFVKLYMETCENILDAVDAIERLGNEQ